MPSGEPDRTVTPFRLEPPKRGIQTPQLVVGVLLVALSALVAVVLVSRAAARDPVLALANDVERGQLVSTADFRVVYVGTDDQLAMVSADGLDSLVGLTAVVDLQEGTIVSPAYFASRTNIAPGEGLVGLALSPGEYPTLRLAPGDFVDVILTGSSSDAGTAGQDMVLVSGAEVFDISELGTQGQRFISLRMTSSDAAEVAQAAVHDRIRLVLVAGGDQ
jgi:Flp pilus assembly protein CpaB